MVRVTVLRYTKGEDYKEIKEHSKAVNFTLDYGPNHEGCGGSPTLMLREASGRIVAAYNSWDTAEIV